MDPTRNAAATMTRAEFDAAMRGAGLALPEPVAAELHGVARHALAMAARCGGERPLAHEPATTFAVTDDRA